ncbi:hypothetical protein FVE85_4672 [Porphyridium purpureum]|uniref:Uncharacterized protein n=1 Tax=Porphyridium purpureum TaxID=35688 RepID=A0A5J4YQM5_PORPP|nr:hypothetical protein FVE85_4672 [Porphyridium purpureum]|eukprot:POR8662..scf236_6
MNARDGALSVLWLKVSSSVRTMALFIGCGAGLGRAALSQGTLLRRDLCSNGRIRTRTRTARDLQMNTRTESVKAALVSAIGGSFMLAPASVAAAYVQGTGLSPQWELGVDMGALSLALFGITYRYCVSESNAKNSMLQQGVVGAFAITRTASALRASPTCVPIPLQCGPPLGYFDYAMLFDGTVMLTESLLAFGFAAICLEFAFRKGWLLRME